jgi:hypothetical protein
MYQQDSKDILQHFYPYNPSYYNSNTNIPAITTNYKIDNVDISNNYVGIGTNSNIKVSDLFNFSYLSNSINIGDLFELNLPVFSSGTINVDYKMFPNNGGLLIQIFKDTTLSFNYNVNCSFCMVGGGGGGGYKDQDNAGGGGGAGEIVTGSINGYIKNSGLNIIIGEGGSSHTPGSQTYITYVPPDYYSNSVVAYGGGYGGRGKENGENTTGSSSGGGGAYSDKHYYAGEFTPRSINNSSIFQSMSSYGNSGSIGNDDGKSEGGGGGGGGAGSAAIVVDEGNDTPAPGGNGMEIMYGSTNFYLAGGGGGGGRKNGAGGNGGGGVGGKGGGPSSTNGGNGFDGTPNTGGGGGGASSDAGDGGKGGSGTVIFYILPSGVTN